MKFAKILIAALAIAFVGCNHSDDDYTPAPAGIKVRVEAGTSEGTRTEFDGTQTTWSAGDKINVAAYNVGGAEKLTEAVLTTQSSAAEALFEGTITEGQYNKIPRGETYDYVAAYPSSAVIAQNGKSVSFAVPASYTATPNSLNGHLFDFMVATADDCASIAVTDAASEYPAFGFKHVLAFLEITLTGNDPIQTVKVDAPAEICGTVSVNPKGDLTPSVSGGSKTITVTINGTLDNGEKLYIPVIPGIAHNGTLTITLTCKNGNTHTITKTLNGKTFVCGKVTKVNGIGYALGEECIAMDDVSSYVEGKNYASVTDVNGILASVTLTEYAPIANKDEVTFYWSESATGAGTAIDGTKSVSGNTVTITATNSTDWNDKEIYVWAKVNHNGNEKTTGRKAVYVIGSGDVLTTSAYTSYSIYDDSNLGADSANNCDPYTIYNVDYTLVKNVPSRIKGEVKTSIVYKTGTTANVSGNVGNVKTAGEYPVKGTITIGNQTITKETPVYITGLPYSVDCRNVSYGDAGWTTTGTVENLDNFGWQTRKYYWLSKWTNTQKTGSLFSPTFYTPDEINVTYTAKMGYFTLGSVGGSATVYSGITTGTTIVTNSKTTTVNQTYRGDKKYTECTDDVSIPAGTGYRIYVGDNQPERKNVAENWVCMGEFNIVYRK